MKLYPELDNFRIGWETRIGETIAQLIAGDIDDLRDSGILDHAAKPGDRFPITTNLLDQHKQRFDLAKVIATKPLIVTFYRGGWCPYCNLELRAYQNLLDDIHIAGAELIAVSPELPDHSLSTAEKNALTFTVLSDVGSGLAAALGIRFSLSEKVRPFYEKAGHALPQRNGDGSWTLPIPATFVIDRSGIIKASFIEPDYRKRLEPTEALAALRGMALNQAA